MVADEGAGEARQPLLDQEERQFGERDCLTAEEAVVLSIPLSEEGEASQDETSGESADTDVESARSQDAGTTALLSGPEGTFDFGGRAKAVEGQDDAQTPNEGKEKAAAAPQERTIFGLALYALSACSQSVMLIFAKVLGNRGMPVFQQLLFRSTIIMAFALIGCAYHRKNPFGNNRKLLAVRGFFGFGAICLYLFAVNLLPLSDAMVLSFLAPLWVALLGPVTIKEHPSKAVLLALPVCMTGVLFITQPPVFGFTRSGASIAGVIIACVQALSSALAKMTVRYLRNSESPFVSVFYLSACSTIGATLGLTLPLLFGHGNDFKTGLTAGEWVLGIGVGVFGWGSQICMTVALKHVKAAPGIAMSYLSVVFGLVAGVLLFSEIPTLLSLLGALLICSCTFLLGVFERKKPAASAPAPVPAGYAPLAAADDDDGRHGEPPEAQEAEERATKWSPRAVFLAVKQRVPVHKYVAYLRSKTGAAAPAV